MAINKESRLAGGCGFIKKDGTPCKLKAGARTDHPGEGCCKHHGGNRGKAVTGRYAHISKIIGARVDKYLNDPRPLSLTRELAMLRAAMEIVLERLEHNAELKEDLINFIQGHGIPNAAVEVDILLEDYPAGLSEKTMMNLSLVVERIAKAVDVASKVQTRHALAASEIVFLHQTLVACIEKYIPESAARVRFIQDIRTMTRRAISS